MSTIKKYGFEISVFAGIGLVIFLVVFVSFSKQAESATTINAGEVIDRGIVRTVDALNATSTAATSTSINVLGAKRVSIYGIMNGFVSTTSAKYPHLSVTFTGMATTTDPLDNNDVDEATSTPHAYTYVRYNKLVDSVTNTNSQTLTRINVKDLAATTSLVSLDLEHDLVSRIRCHISNLNYLQTGQGATCRIIIEW